MQFLFVTKQTHVEVRSNDPASYLGVWKSAGGLISQELLPYGRYLKQKGSRPVVEGSYNVEGGRIFVECENGAAYEGEFAQGRLHQAGMIFYKVM